MIGDETIPEHPYRSHIVFNSLFLQDHKTKVECQKCVKLARGQ